MEGYGNENPGAFQSTRPLRGATALLGINAVVLSISTHAPLAGRDTSTLPSCSTPAEFQPTRPLRGATDLERAGHMMGRYFNPRAPCGARPGSWQVYKDCDMISTHAPLAGRDSVCSLFVAMLLVFQPTRPLRGATIDNYCKNPYKLISTHAPLAGRDNTHIAIDKPLINFNPRAPCGARLSRCRCGIRSKNFNPRAPCGARPATAGNMLESWYFNPRAPCGARLAIESIQ